MAGGDERKLYVAATQGDVTMFQDVLRESPDLLDGAPYAYSRNLLHIATMWEQVGIVDEVLRRNPKLATDLDSQTSSPLHIAAANGNLQISSKLLAVAPKMCWSLDCQGMNPIHIAAMNGNVEVLEQLLQLNPSPAMERLNRGQTISHLCIKHGQLRTLRVVLEKFGDLLYAEDDDGETLVHSAVRGNEPEIVRYLVGSKNKFPKTTNSMMFSPMEILFRMPKNDTTSAIKKILRKGLFLFPLVPNSKGRDALTVVAALIATVAYQSIISPPGGVWQADSSMHKAGEAVMATNQPNMYKSYVYLNTIAFVASLIAIGMLIPGNASITKIPSFIGVYAFFISVSCAVISYLSSIRMMFPNA